MMRSAVWMSGLVAGVALWGAGAPGTGRDTADTLTIGAYSVVRDVLHEAILPRFAAHWEQKTGRKLRFEESYSGSGARHAPSPRALTPTWRFFRSRGTSTSW